MHASQTEVWMTLLQELLQRFTTPWGLAAPPVVFVYWTAMYWFRTTFTGVARTIVANVKVVSPVTASTSWTVKVWPLFTWTQTWPGKLHGGPILVVVGVDPAGKVSTSSWFGATSPTNRLMLAMLPVMGDFMTLPVPQVDPSPAPAKQEKHPAFPQGGLPVTFEAVKPRYWLVA